MNGDGITRVLMAGDTHGNGNHISHLIATARRNDCQAVFVLGDFGYWEHQREGVEFLDRTSAKVADGGTATPVYFLDGNHDKTSLLLNTYTARDDAGFVVIRSATAAGGTSPTVLYAPRGHRWEWAGTRFIALGGAYSVDKPWRLAMEKRRGKPESLWFPEEEMTDENMAAILTDSSPVDVMLAHDKPRAANPGWNRKDLPECWPNQDRLQLAVMALQPKLFMHGHLHHRYSTTIRTGDDDQWCRVEGLAADPDAENGQGYRREFNRVVLDVATLEVSDAA